MGVTVRIDEPFRREPMWVRGKVDRFVLRPIASAASNLSVKNAIAVIERLRASYPGCAITLATHRDSACMLLPRHAPITAHSAQRGTR